MTNEDDSGPEEIGIELAEDARVAAVVPPVTADGRNIDMVPSGPTAWRAYLRALGPGLVTGASDDDPSGIATYAQTGARFGFGMLWVALVTFPLMAGVQEICDRTALATGKGLGELIVARFGRAWRVAIGLLIGALIIANALNIAADLVAVGAGMHLLHAGPTALWAVLAGVIIMVLLVSGSFATIARVFKVLCAALLAYVGVLSFVKTPGGRSSSTPSCRTSGSAATTLRFLSAFSARPFRRICSSGKACTVSRTCARKMPEEPARCPCAVALALTLPESSPGAVSTCSPAWRSPTSSCSRSSLRQLSP